MSLTKPKLQLSEMLEYKFQILVDGYSAAWDSSFWKLSSGSAVFYVLPQSNVSAAHQVRGSFAAAPAAKCPELQIVAFLSSHGPSGGILPSNRMCITSERQHLSSQQL